MKTFNSFYKKASLGMMVAILAAAPLVTRAADATEGQMPPPGQEKAMLAKRGENMQQKMMKHHARLHDKLKLNAEQEAAWQTYTAAMMKKPEHAAHPDHAKMAALSAPEKMEKMIAMMQKGTEHMQARLATLKTFYATLTPEQQAIFNKEFRPHHPHHPMMRPAAQHKMP